MAHTAFHPASRLASDADANAAAMHHRSSYTPRQLRCFEPRLVCIHCSLRIQRCMLLFRHEVECLRRRFDAWPPASVLQHSMLLAARPWTVWLVLGGRRIKTISNALMLLHAALAISRVHSM